MEYTVPALIEEITGRLDAFDRNLPTQIDPPALSRAKLPFKALAYRETLIYRVTELGQAAMEDFSRRRFAAAILLTRAAVETAAALWYLSVKLTAAIAAKSVGDLDPILMQLSMGHRTDGEFPKAINVTTFVQHIEKQVPGFEHQYATLSEYSHPNYLGTAGLYEEIDTEHTLVHFGKCMRSAAAAQTIGLVNLSVALMIFEHTYNALADQMPTFVALCEDELAKPRPAP